VPGYFGGVRGINCVPFESVRGRTSDRRRQISVSTLVSGLARGGRLTATAAPPRDEMSGHLSPAQHAFLGGVLALLSDHGEDALTRSCEMVIARFGRGRVS
jgi:hypothetical protein